MVPVVPPTEKKLFTPGPLCCSSGVKAAMCYDLGSRDQQFLSCVREIRQGLLDIAGVSSPEFTAVLLQGSGTYTVEAVLQTTSPRQGAKVLILANGAYGLRMKKICEVAGISCQLEEFPENKKIDLIKVKEILQNDTKFTTVGVVHCETSSGVINPVEELGCLIKTYQPGAMYFVDAMSSFGAIPLDLKASHIDFMVSSANKCLEGIPGFAYVICRTQCLVSCKGNSRSYSLDIVDQFEGLQKNGQFRFTPPTHSMLAFRQALEEYKKAGGLPARKKRYMENRAVLKHGMKDLGFRELLDEAVHEGYIITSYFIPEHPNFHFQTFYTELSNRDYVIYPGKVSKANCFRIGNIGHLFPSDMKNLLHTIKEVLNIMEAHPLLTPQEIM
ncbi:2-aminoethylphosphonate--pyruvate transaminase-like [Oratosquilla oratoria]|uniref:2-aminoethylphosphonate--pyruvate transaminase-like n=1 Tax=Oratosquilla oratoria TaxID=337810 RepID=UPI003F774DFC